MLTIDGSRGEGGGQILRTSLALSMITGQSVRLENIRAGRAKPGLLRQHLTAVQAARQVCGGGLTGAAIGSQAIEFHPGPVIPGDYHFAIGTAGSTTLVLQTVLPALMRAERPSTIAIEGGTHNIHAPTAHFLERAFLPLLARMGPRVHANLARHGFYPAGGGRIEVAITPAPSLAPIDLLTRGDVRARSAVALVAGLPGEIAKRELAVVKGTLGFTDEELHIHQIKDHHGQGNVLSIEIESDSLTEIITGFGRRGTAAEEVAAQAAASAAAYLAAGVPVWEHLADQLLLPMALATGPSAFVTGPLTEHTRTNIDTIRRFLPATDITTSEHASGAHMIRVQPQPT